MSVKVESLMTPQVITTRPHVQVGHVKGMMRNSKVGVIPVVDSEGKPVGIVSASDLIDDLSDRTPVSRVMTERIYTISGYEDVATAARVMRNHQIHHLVVTHEQKVTGIVSTYDLIKLVEGKRFVMKNGGSPSTRRRSRRG